jgi:predicted MFS family arabinose efflux permease
MKQQKTGHGSLITGGFLALVIAMGVGRFAYTPLLPAMQNQFGFSDEIAGSIASVNYLGYLLGALLCFKNMRAATKLRLFRISLIASIITTAWMGLVAQTDAWMILRLVSGMASAGIFIIGSSIVMGRLPQSKNSLCMLIYSGVGVGIALSGVLSPVMIKYFNVQISWMGLSLICFPLSLVCWFVLIPSADESKADLHSNGAIKFEYPLLLPWLMVAYFCEGFGYIISGTFIVSFLQGQSGFFSSGPVAWTMVGLAASVSIPVFHQLSKRLHLVYVLIIAHLIQGLGIVLPVLSSHWLCVISGAVLFGGTFMGITALTLSIGKTLKPGQSQKVIGLLTAIYGVGQILGPLVSGVLSENSGNFVSSIMISAIVVILGGLILITGVLKHTMTKRQGGYDAVR